MFLSDHIFLFVYSVSLIPVKERSKNAQKLKYRSKGVHNRRSISEVCLDRQVRIVFNGIFIDISNRTLALVGGNIYDISKFSHEGTLIYPFISGFFLDIQSSAVDLNSQIFMPRKFNGNTRLCLTLRFVNIFTQLFRLILSKLILLPVIDAYYLPSKVFDRGSELIDISVIQMPLKFNLLFEKSRRTRSKPCMTKGIRECHTKMIVFIFESFLFIEF